MRLSAIGLIVTFTLSMLVGPLAVAAQQPAKIPRIGMLVGGSLDWTAPTLEAFRQRLHELGYVEGHTITIDYRFAEGKSGVPAVTEQKTTPHVNVVISEMSCKLLVP